MKKQLFKKLLVFIVLLVSVIIFSFMTNFANAQETIQQKNLSTEKTINPSAVFTIQKADPYQIKSALQKSSFRQKNFRINHNRRFSKAMSGEKLFSLHNNPAQENYKDEKPNGRPCRPSLETNFEGNPLTPFYLPPVGYYASESSIAVSNSGKIVSISNGWIRYYNADGKLTFSDSLYHFSSGLIDVRVMYDPQKDRFVFISAYGVTDFNSEFQGYGIVAAFSKTNDPIDGWNFYYMPDSVFNDNSIGDYPQLGISNDEVFITGLRLDEDGNITHSLIIQLNKNDGYKGNAAINMQSFLIPLSSVTQGSVVPASGGSKPYGPNMYFVMADETGNEADSFFVLEIISTIKSGKAALKIYGSVHSNISYSPAPLSYQPGQIPLYGQNEGFDDYVQNAFYENGLIQFSQNNGVNGKAAVYVGRIRGIPNHLACEAHAIYEKHLSLLFPQIVYTGNSRVDNRAIVGLEYTGVHKYPGLAAVSIDNNFSISKRLDVKAGNDTINGLWGDYSAICRRYNHPGECWMEGQYGSKTFPNINWIAKLKSQECSFAQAGDIEETKSIFNSGHALAVYPNPFLNSTTISFSFLQSTKVSIKIFAINGQLVKTLADNNYEAGSHQLEWNAEGNITPGVYFLKMQSITFLKTLKLIVKK